MPLRWKTRSPPYSKATQCDNVSDASIYANNARDSARRGKLESEIATMYRTVTVRQRKMEVLTGRTEVTTQTRPARTTATASYEEAEPMPNPEPHLPNDDSARSENETAPRISWDRSESVPGRQSTVSADKVDHRKPGVDADADDISESCVSMRDQYLPENDAPEEERAAWREFYRAVAERRYAEGD